MMIHSSKLSAVLDITMTRCKIARYAISNGNSRAARHFSDILGKSLNESTVRSIKDSYNRAVSLQPETDKVTELPRSPRGKPLKIGQCDSMVQEYIRKLRISGGIVNSRIVISAAKGIILATDKTMLTTYGGPVELDKPWAKSLMNRMGLCKRKGTKGVKTLPDDFENIKVEFLNRIDSVVKRHHIPDSLIINWDQTGSNYIPVSGWTMEEKGTRQVPIAQLDDKRQMTVLLSCTKSGSLLPPQLIYQGRTDACHPSYNFPKEWEITHSESHWSTSDTMISFIQNIIIPYIEQQKDEHDLPLRQHALCVFDIYKAHQGENLRQLLQKHNIDAVYVPAACTDRLQPLDLSVNSVFKQHMKSNFEDWYSQEISKQIQKESDMSKVNIDMRLSVVKPLHAKWLVHSLGKLASDETAIKRGWAQAGIV